MSRSQSTSSAPATELRWKIAATWPFSDRLSSSLRVLAVRIMIGIARVSSRLRSCSTTSKPLTPGIMRSRRMRFGSRDLAISIPCCPLLALSTLKPAGFKSASMRSRFGCSSSTNVVGGLNLNRMEGGTPFGQADLNSGLINRRNRFLNDPGNPRMQIVNSGRHNRSAAAEPTRSWRDHDHTQEPAEHCAPRR